MNDTLKRCTQCERHKKLEEFSPHNSRPCGYQAACKSCRSAYARARNNPAIRQLLKKGTPK